MPQRVLTISVNVSGNAAQALGQIRSTLAGLTGATNQSTASTNADAKAKTASATATKAQSVAISDNKQKLNALQQQMDANRRTSYALTIAGYQLASAGKAVDSALGSSLTTFADYDYSLRRAAGSLELFDTQSALYGELNDQVIRLAQSTKMFDPQQIAKGMYFWGSTTGQVVDQTKGLAVASSQLNDIFKQVTPVMQAALMTETDMETVLKGAVGVSQQYGLGLASVGHITEVLFYAAQKTAAELPDMIQAMKMVGPVAAQMGVSFDQTIQMLMSLANAGLKGSMAGRALRQMFRQMNRETPAAASALDAVTHAALGTTKSFHDVVFEGGQLDMRKFLGTLAVATRGLDDAQRGYLFSTIATAAEMPTLIALVNAENAAMLKGTSILDAKSSNLDDAAANFQKNWQVMSDSVKGSLGDIANSFAPVILDIGKAVAAAVAFIKPIVTGVAGFARMLLEANPTITGVVVGLVALGGTFTAIAGTALLALGAFNLVTGTVMRMIPLHQLQQAVLAETAATTTVATSANTALAASMAEVAVAAEGETAALVGVSAASAEASVAGASIGSKMLAGLKSTIANPAMLTAIFAVVVGAAYTYFSSEVSKKGDELKAQATTWAKDATDAQLAAGLEAVRQGQDSVPTLPLFNWDVLGGKDQAQKAADVIVQAMVDREVKGLDSDAVKKKLAEAQAKLQEMLSNPTSTQVFTKVNDQGVVIGSSTIEKPNYTGNELKNAQDQVKALQSAVSSLVSNDATKKYFTDLALGIDDTTNSFNDATDAITGSIDALGIVRTSADQAHGAFAPFTLTLDEFSRDANGMAFLGGKSYIDQFQAGMFKSKDQLLTVSTSLINDFLTNIKSKNPKLQEAGMTGLAEYVKGWYASGNQNITPMAQAISNAAYAALQSSNPKFQAEGQALMRNLAEEMQKGASADFGPAIQSAMAFAQQQIASSSPAAREEGRKWLLMVAQGMLDSGDAPTGQALATMNALIANLGSGNIDSAFLAEGYNYIASLADGMYQANPLVAQALKTLSAVLAPAIKVFNAMGLTGFGNAFQSVLDTANRATKQSITSTKKLNVNLNPIGIGGGSTGSGGSGSSGSTAAQTSPLEDALKVAQQGVDLQTALRKLQGVDLKTLVQQTMGGVAEAISLSVTIALGYAKNISTADLQTVADFSAAGTAVAQSLSAAITAFTAMDTMKVPSTASIATVVDLISFVMAQMAAKGKAASAEDLANASEFGTTAQSVLSAVSGAIDAFTKVPTTYAGVNPGILKSLVGDMVSAVLEMAAQAPAMTDAQSVLVTAFAGTGGAVVQAIASTFNAFKDMVSYTAPLPGMVQSIIGTVVMSVRMMASAMGDLGLSSDQVTQIAAFADLATKISAAISAVYDTFNVKINFVDQFVQAPDLTVLFGQMRAAMDGFIAISSSYSSDAISKANSLAEAASSIAAAIDAFFGIGQNASHDPEVLGALTQQALQAVMTTVASFIESFYGSGSSLIQQFVAGMQSQESLLANEMARIEGLLGGAMPGVKLSDQAGTNVTVTHVIKDPDGVLKNASPQQVADLLSGQEFISNMWHAVATQ